MQKSPKDPYTFGDIAVSLFAGLGQRGIAAERNDICTAVESDDLNCCFFVGFLHGVHPPFPNQLLMPIAVRYATSASWN